MAPISERVRKFREKLKANPEKWKAHLEKGIRKGEFKSVKM